MRGLILNDNFWSGSGSCWSGNFRSGSYLSGNYESGPGSATVVLGLTPLCPYFSLSHPRWQQLLFCVDLDNKVFCLFFSPCFLWTLNLQRELILQVDPKSVLGTLRWLGQQKLSLCVGWTTGANTPCQLRQRYFTPCSPDPRVMNKISNTVRT